MSLNLFIVKIITFTQFKSFEHGSSIEKLWNK